MEERNCAFCGEGFAPKVHNQRYCCVAHKQKANNKSRLGVGDLPSGPPTVSEMDDAALAAELSRRGYSVEIDRLVQDQRYTVKTKRFKGGCFKLGAISCTHLGSRYQQLTALREFYEVCKEREITTVLHAGDLTDGDGSVYPGQIYEMFSVGFDSQVSYAVNNYPSQDGITTKIIGGNHDDSYLKSAHANILRRIADQRKDIEYLGEFGAFLEVGGINIYLMHGGGSPNTYARSYKLQKIVENMTPENKPHILLLGHWHTACHLPQYRNVEAFALGAFQSQTPLLKRMGIWPTTTALILEIYPDDKGIAKVRSEWLHWHIMRERDY